MCFLNTLKVLSEGMTGNKDLLRCWLETGSWGAVGAALGRAEQAGLRARRWRQKRPSGLQPEQAVHGREAAGTESLLLACQV